MSKFIYCSKSKTFDNYHSWIMQQCPHIVSIKQSSMLIKDVDDVVEGKWSSYYEGDYCRRTAFFELESDAMAFKLKWT